MTDGLARHYLDFLGGRGGPQRIVVDPPGPRCQCRKWLPTVRQPTVNWRALMYRRPDMTVVGGRRKHGRFAAGRGYEGVAQHYFFAETAEVDRIDEQTLVAGVPGASSTQPFRAGDFLPGDAVDRSLASVRQLLRLGALSVMDR